MTLSNLPGPWRWEQRGDSWWRVNARFQIEDGPHPEPIKAAEDDIMQRVTLYGVCLECGTPRDVVTESVDGHTVVSLVYPCGHGRGDQS